MRVVRRCAGIDYKFYTKQPEFGVVINTVIRWVDCYYDNNNNDYCYYGWIMILGYYIFNGDYFFNGCSI